MRGSSASGRRLTAFKAVAPAFIVAKVAGDDATYLIWWWRAAATPPTLVLAGAPRLGSNLDDAAEWKLKKGIASKDSTTIAGGMGEKKKIADRIAQLRNEIDNAKSDFDKEKLGERLAKLAGGVAVIKVGAATETELKEKKLRIEDAINATRAAVDEGIVPGGGVALLKARKVLESVDAKGDEATGAKIVWKALEAPARQIATNAGKDGAVVVARVLDEKEGFGYDAATDQYVDMVKAGILDPMKVTRSALQNAASIAAMFLTTEAAVTDIPEKKDSAGHGGHDHGGGMDDMGF